MSDDQNKDVHNQAGLMAFAGSFLFVFVFMIYVAGFHKGVVLDTPRELSEGGGAGLAKVFDPSKVEKVWVASAELIEHGQKVYKNNCATCHGNQGGGDGVAAAGMIPAPRNLIAGGWKYGGDEVGLYKTLQNGVAGTSMVSYKAVLKPGDRWALVHYIQSITKDLKKTPETELAQFAQGAD